MIKTVNKKYIASKGNVLKNIFAISCNLSFPHQEPRVKLAGSGAIRLSAA